ncbi:hypothetical protein M514_26810 [Trichuris suis]|uniref:C2H2-type domain-containing protein n=1 Tax=Trichuris suis TaxID=68888 RepID=A0A085MUV7_9BILA|nr:hypothetical protein M514_26810 [Trichuris suis]
MRSKIRHDKIRLSPEEKPGVVYEVTCSCSASYIGETDNSVSQRFNQHLSCLIHYRNELSDLQGKETTRRGRPRKTDPHAAMDAAISASATVEHASHCNGQGGFPPDHLFAWNMKSSIRGTPTIDPQRTAGGEEAVPVSATYPGPFRCSQCQFATTTAFHFVNHVRSHGGKVESVCGKCSRRFPTIHGVSTHHYRCVVKHDYGVPTTASGIDQPSFGFNCPECSIPFNAYSGLQLHRLRAHPHEFAAEQPQQRKPRWTKFELDCMMKLEAALPATVKNINQTLQQLLHDRFGIVRNVEMIKGQRRKLTYKNDVESLRLQQANVTDAEPDNELEQAGAIHISQEQDVANLEEHPLVKGFSITSDDQGACCTAPNAGAIQLHNDTVASFLQKELSSAWGNTCLEKGLKELVMRAMTGENVLEESATLLIEYISPQRRKIRHWTLCDIPQRLTRRKRSKMEYKELSKLYHTNRKRIAEVLFGDASIQRSSLSVEDCARDFEAVFASSSPADDQEVKMKRHEGYIPADSKTVMAAITIDEVTAAMKRLPKKSSPRPDNVSVQSLRSI